MQGGTRRSGRRRYVVGSWQRNINFRAKAAGPSFDVTPKDKNPGEFDSLAVGSHFSCCERVGTYGRRLAEISLTMEHFPRARVGLATHRTASWENNRCCPCLL